MTLLFALLGKISELLISKSRKSLLGSLNERSLLYQQLVDELFQINNCLRKIIRQPLNTSFMYLKLGCISNNSTDFQKAEEYAIVAFNLSDDVNDKVLSLYIAILAVSHCYELDIVRQRFKILIDFLILDRSTQNLFRFITEKKITIMDTLKHLSISCLSMIAAITGTFFIPIIYSNRDNSDKNNITFNNYIVSWMINHNYEYDHCLIPELMNYSCNSGDKLKLVGLQKEAHDLQLIDLLLTSYHEMAGDVEIILYKDIKWKKTGGLIK